MKTLILVMLLAVMHALQPAPGRAAATPGQGSADSQKDGEQNEKSAPAPTHIEPLKQAVPTHDRGEQVAPHNSENSVNLTHIPPITIVKEEKTGKDHLFDWGPWVFSLFLVGVGFWQVLLLFRTLGAIKRQAGTMERQEKILADSVAVAERSANAALSAANVAAREIQIAVERERPRIAVEVEPLELKDPSIRGAGYIVDCWCPTPAFIVEAGIHLGFDLGENEKPKAYFVIPINKQVHETTKFSLHVGFMRPLSEGILEEIVSQEKTVWLWGFITYRGVQLSTKDSPYRTSFRWRWNAADMSDDPEFGVDFSSWRREGRPEENQQT